MKHKLNSLSRHQVILSQIHETEFIEKVRQIERKTPKMQTSLYEFLNILKKFSV